jgi:hypothetical protein
MENRIKECQLDLFADRTSASTMRANQLRLWFAAMAYVLAARFPRPVGNAMGLSSRCRRASPMLRMANPIKGRVEGSGTEIWGQRLETWGILGRSQQRQNR